MIPLILLAGAVTITAGAAAIYWKNIKVWIERVMERLPYEIRQYLEGAISFVESIGHAFKNIMKYYSFNRETKQWNETVVTQTVEPSAIPPFIRKRAEAEGITETTEDFEKNVQVLSH